MNGLGIRGVMHGYDELQGDTFVFLGLQLLPISLVWCGWMQKD